MTYAKQFAQTFWDGFTTVLDLGPMPQLRPIPYHRVPFPTEEESYARALEQVAQTFRHTLATPNARRLLEAPAQ